MEYLKMLMDRISFPDEAKECLIDAASKAPADDKRLVELTDMLMAKSYSSADDFLKPLAELAAEREIHEFTMNLLFFMRASKRLQKRYRDNGISEELFYFAMDDYRCKMHECYEVKGVWGIFVPTWYPPFFHMNRFALGRLQFEKQTFRRVSYSKNGNSIKEGELVLNIHIPSTGPLTVEKRHDSYKRAYDFYHKEFDGRKVAIVCNSWLLFPKHEEFLPANSNILGFMRDFDIIDGSESDEFTNSWRIFGKHHENPPEKLPTDTSLRAAYAKWLIDGNKTGSGYGILFHDGERIYN